MCKYNGHFVLFLYLLQCCICRVELIYRGQCGYKQCPQTREGALNVHLIPHSHMDAGWVKTFDEYYYGTRTQVSTANVQLIFHSVLSELLHDKNRKFTFAESAYFWRWWKEQRPSMRNVFRTLVQEGRIEIAGGSWVQNDEATADYEAIIDSYTWGLRKINDTLGPCAKPKAAWQIDTYGHSREQASLLAQMGYDGLFISRVDYKEREAMIDEDRLEFMWRGSDLLGKMSDIMTHTLFNLYNPPEGFCFDFLCNDEPIMNDPESNIYNADKRVSEFIAHIEHQAKYYDHDNIVVMMGGDFAYQSAASWFMNMDKLINHVHKHSANLSDINIFYSSPSCYLKAIYLYGRRDKTMHTEKGDYFPYGTDAQTYWSGYYTSRPSLKYLIKRSHQFLQVFKQLSVITRFDDSYELHLLRHAVSLAHHHDAITGTSQQHVANDFIRILTDALDASMKKVSVMLSHLTPSWGGSRRTKNQQQFVVCHDLNVSQCIFSETQDTLLLLLYNPSSVKTYHFVRLPATMLSYSIKDANDDDVEYQLLPLPPPVINLPGRRSAALQELVFEAESVPALGYASFYVTAVHDAVKETAFTKNTNSEENLDKVYCISNEYIRVHVNKDTGLLETLQHQDGARVQVSQNFFYYSQTTAPVHSGAYSFRPGSLDAVPVSDKASIHTIRGPLVKEIRQRFSDWVSQVIRLYRGEEFVELEWVIGPVPLGTDLGKEVVSRFSTNISSQEFFTDSNGRQMMRRSCWNETNTAEKKQKYLPSCYYPVTSRICIQGNDSSGLCVLVDRSQGGASYRPGEVEVMVHRRLLTDDGFGLEESLNEEEGGVGLIVRGKQRIVFGRRKPEDKQSFFDRASQAALRWKYEPWAFLASGDRINRRKWANVRNKRFSSLHSHGVPPRVHVLTLEPWRGGAVLLRLENTVTDNSTQDPPPPSSHEDSTPAEAGTITVDLRKLFLQRHITSVRETTLAANQWLDEARQMDWSSRYIYSGGNDAFGLEDVPDAYGNDGHVIDYDDTYNYGQRKQRESVDNENEMDHSMRNYEIKSRSKRESNKVTPENVIRNSGLEEYETRHILKDVTEDQDDVTKSIYEMYYKTNSWYSRKNNERTVHRKLNSNKAPILSPFKNSHSKNFENRSNGEELFNEHSFESKIKHDSLEPDFNLNRKRREILIEKDNLFNKPKRSQTKSLGAFMPFFITDEKLDRRLREHRKTEAHRQISAEENSSPLVKDMFVKKLDTKAIKRSFDDDDYDSDETPKIKYNPPPSATKIVSTTTATVRSTTIEEELIQSDEEDVETTKSSTILSTTKVTTEASNSSPTLTSTETPVTTVQQKSFSLRRIARVTEQTQYNIFDDEDKFRDSSKEEKGYIPSKSFKGLFSDDEAKKQSSTKVYQLNVKSIFQKKYGDKTESSTEQSEKLSTPSKISSYSTTDEIDLKLKEFFENNIKIDSNDDKHANVPALNTAVTDKIMEQNPTEPEKEEKKGSRKTQRDIKYRSDENEARAAADQITDDNEYHNAEEDFSNKRRKRAIPVKKREEIKDTSEPEAEDEHFIVTLRPTQIRTFVIRFKS
ncbi:lysosomal alpha-mannosidase [Plutella xylostella]|uniref:lysosomal alpha-mannosidase n=1 Tax=Plutella xylostella TaxID=51655 RepID=UPI002032301D|nr:lysosomal alpha-mannosidase [Plutella xylostella]